MSDRVSWLEESCLGVMRRPGARDLTLGMGGLIHLRGSASVLRSGHTLGVTCSPIPKNASVGAVRESRGAVTDRRQGHLDGTDPRPRASILLACRAALR